MDMGGKADDDGVNFNSSNLSSCTASWELNSANLAMGMGMGMVPNSNPNIDSFCSAIWDQPNSVPPNGMLKGSLLPPTVTGAGLLPQILPHFQVDSDFIERAVRISCFSGGRNMGGDGLECSDRGGQELSDSAVGQSSSAKGLCSKKRKRSGQGAELQPVEAANDKTEIQQKGDQNTASNASRPGGENDKQGSQTSDTPKEEYIHVRARRGQATNSHSLAERVRREKISERMKFLQDLVPGCNKVIGKAVMLDEIINYVLSLQRQVEFLSMKLATINPGLDFNSDVVFPKDISRASSSSSLAFPPDMAMPYPTIHPPQPMLIQGGLPGLENSTAALHRTINSQLPNTSETDKDPTSKVSNTWNELHNVFQMGFNSTAPLSSEFTSRIRISHHN